MQKYAFSENPIAPIGNTTTTYLCLSDINSQDMELIIILAIFPSFNSCFEHRWASSFSPWEGVHFFSARGGSIFSKQGGGQGGVPWKKNSLEFLKSAIRAEKLLQK